MFKVVFKKQQKKEFRKGLGANWVKVFFVCSKYEQLCQSPPNSGNHKLKTMHFVVIM